MTTVDTMDLPGHQLTMTVLMTPDMANFAGNVHGGSILKLLDQVASACASRSWICSCRRCRQEHRQRHDGSRRRRIGAHAAFGLPGAASRTVRVIGPRWSMVSSMGNAPV